MTNQQAQDVAETGPTRSKSAITRRPSSFDIDPVGHARTLKIIYTTLGFGVPIALLALWEIAARSGWINRKIYPTPIDCLDTIKWMFQERDFAYDIRLTLKRLLFGYMWGCLLGLTFAYLMGMSRVIRAALEPMFNALYTVPKIALLSIFLIIFGFDDTPVILVVTATVFFFAWVPTQAAVMSVSESYREAAMSFGASRWQLFRHVIWPATLPGLFVTLRVAASVSVLTIIGIEFAYAPKTRGLGYQINNARQTFEPKLAYAGIIIAALIGVIFQMVVRRVGRLVVRWEKEDRGAPVV